MSDNPVETEYYLRLLSMYIDLGTESVLKVFYYCIPKDDVDQFLSNENSKKCLNALKVKNVLKKREYDLVTALYPNPDKFDITLLITLLSSLVPESDLPPPANGWQNKLDKSDLSLAADLIRLRKIRNRILCHRPKAQLPESQFELFWSEVEAVLLRIIQQVSPIEDNDLRKRILKYKEQNLDASVKAKYNDLLDAWEEEIDVIQEQVEDLLQALKEFDTYFKESPCRFERYIRVLTDGGQLVLSAILDRELEKRGLSLVTCIKENEALLKSVITDEPFISCLYPTVTRQSDWDISVIAKVILHCFDKVNSEEKKEVEAILSARENYAETARLSLDSDSLAECREELIVSLHSLSHGLSKEVRDKLSELIKACRSRREDSKSTKSYVDRLQQKGSLIRSLADVHKDTVQKLKSTLDHMERNGIPFRKIQKLEIKLQTASINRKTAENAEEALFTALKESIEKAIDSTDLPTVRREIDTILGYITDHKGIEKIDVFKGCIIITIDCSTPSGSLHVLDMLDKDSFQTTLANVSLEISTEMEDTVAIQSSLTLDSLHEILVCPNDAHQENQGIGIPLEISSAEGLNSVLSLFESRKLANSANRIAGSLSSHFDETLTVNISHDLSGLTGKIKMSEGSPQPQRRPGKLSVSSSPDGKRKTPEKPKNLPPKPILPAKIIKRPASKETTQADNPIFLSPMILVSTVNGKTTCNQSTLTKLGEIEKPLNIVSVVGTLRTGKSFILNKLATHGSAGNQSWFETGHTTTAVTKGIWVMCRPHPTQDDQVLVLLDTEGIDDPDKIDIEDDKNLFILATLLSSTMIYNTRGNFDRNAIDKFKFLDRIKTSIKVNGSEEDDSILDFFFPNFVLALRDVTLDIRDEDDDAYLENMLKLKRRKKGESVKAEFLKEYNLPRILIRRYFKKRKCFRFRKPVKHDLLKELMTLPETTLKAEFQDTLNEFRDFIFYCQPKLMKSGKAINGRMLSSLLLNYVHSIQVGESPCLTSAMVSMSAVENTHVVKKATEVYKAEMKRRLASNTPSESGLVNYHKDSIKVALEVLKSGLIIDDEQIYEEQSLICFKNQFETLKNNVKKDLEAKCLHTLKRLDTLKIQVKIKNRKYCTPTGYDDYMKDIDSLIQQFNREAGYMGSVARMVLQGFLDEKVEEEENVYKMVLEALDGEEGPARRKIKRLSLFREEDANTLKEEEEVEEAIRADIEMLQVNGLQSIGKQYLDMLKTKIAEVDRVKKELTRDDSYYRKLCKETSHWKDIFDKATFNLSHYRRQLKLISEKNVKDMEGTVYNELWEDVIGPLWKKALEKDESVDITPQSSVDEEFRHVQEESAIGDGITVLPDRVPPEGMSDEPVYSDPAEVEERRKPDKCDIL